MAHTLLLERTPKQAIEWALDCEYAERLDMAVPVAGLVRLTTPPAVFSMLMSAHIVQTVHVEALRRISEALGHPFKDVADKTALDLADLAVVAILRKAEA